MIGAVIGREFSYELLAAVSLLPIDQLKATLEQSFAGASVLRRTEEATTTADAVLQVLCHGANDRTGRDDLALGQRVFHGKFGYGTIVGQEGNKLEIDFEHAGRKKVLDSFVSAG